MKNETENLKILKTISHGNFETEISLCLQNACTMHTSDIEGYRCVVNPSMNPKVCNFFIFKT